jgi:dynein heavy chain
MVKIILSLVFNTCFVFALFHQPGGGRNEVDPRFISLFSVFNVTFPSEESLTKIYSSILDGHLQPFSKEIRELTVGITASTLNLYTQIVHNHPPTPSKFHYIFNLRDLSRVYQGLCLIVPDRFEKANQFIRVWRNECLRVFHDRLTNAGDKAAVQVSLSVCFGSIAKLAKL